MSSQLKKEIALAKEHARIDAISITNWYQVRRQQALLELEKLETAYNERMAENVAELSIRLYQLNAEQELMETGDARHIVQHIPKLRRKTNLCSLPEYGCLWNFPSASKSVENFDSEAIDQEMLQTNFHSVPRLKRPQNVQYMSAEDLNHEIDILTPLVHDDVDMDVDQYSIEVRATEVAVVSDDEGKSSDSHSPDAEEMC